MSACPICGTESPGNVARCPACNADLATAGALMDDILGSPPPPRAAPSARPAAKARPPYAAAAKTALLFGGGAAIGLGIVLAALAHVVAGDTANYTAFKTGLGAGGIIGLVSGSVWGATSVLETELGMSALIGMVMGAVEVTMHYYMEWMVLAQPDYAVYLYTLMGCGAGAAMGAFSVVLRSYREGR